MTSAAPVQLFGNGTDGELGAVAVAAEVGQHHALELVPGNFADECGRGFVAEVTVPAEDALFDGPGPSGIVLEEADVVVGLQDEQVGVADALDDEPRDVAEVGEDADGLRLVADEEVDRVERVVGHGERFDVQVADGKRCAVGEQAPRDGRGRGKFGGEGFGGEAVGVHGQRVLFAENR